MRSWLLVDVRKDRSTVRSMVKVALGTTVELEEADNVSRAYAFSVTRTKLTFSGETLVVCNPISPKV